MVKTFMELKSAIASTYAKIYRIDELSETDFNKLLAESIIKASFGQYQVNSLNNLYSQ